MKNYAITSPLDCEFTNCIINLQKKINSKFLINDRLLNSVGPHVMWSAGVSVLNENDLVQNIREHIIFLNKINLKFNGIGIFLNKKPTFYVRWTNTEEVKSFYENIMKFSKKIFKNFHTSCYPEIWLPKTTLVTNDTDLECMNKVSKVILNSNFPDKTCLDEISLLSFDTKREYLIQRIKLN